MESRYAQRCPLRSTRKGRSDSFFGWKLSFMLWSKLFPRAFRARVMEAVARKARKSGTWISYRWTLIQSFMTSVASVKSRVFLSHQEFVARSERRNYKN
ncbi:hypothetical protein BDV32DRAFT_125787 [Aspergillus pseudonomiae]|uniref:Uncharacterized protein n=1 Tax=Aspergillus pseudonomiae TaxID=1506151 RepID=A0A5N6HX49_9EURO|nr:uncharacterized protein BDV37DRAFT_241463 [Aspergillus pseudonomiae]KAB8258434.1 hypothetical protein BDV32DRAFT_125787 [Aspergillus pseudonomiae]KAE8407290.1 hypothetical protein BDV37DRAFT_241463 [Aspergillus pseudonomiae]